MTGQGISQETSEAIRARISALEGPGTFDLHDVARRHNALPVYIDMGGALFLTPDGDILVLEHDGKVPQVEPDPGWRLTAIVSAAEKYPELGSLLPIRPDGVANCSGCGGKGKIELGEVVVGCGDCRGLGWRA